MTYPDPDRLSQGPRVYGPLMARTVPSLQPERGTALDPHLLDVIELVADGCTNHEIGSRLGISEDAVKSRLRIMFRLLRVKDRTQLVVAGFRVGALRLPQLLDHKLSCDVHRPRTCTCGVDELPTEETPTS